MRLIRPESWLDETTLGRRDNFLVFAVWFVFVVPLFILRGYHFEEGLAVAIAREAIANGWWIEHHTYGQRVVERPNLLADIIAVLGLARGGIEPWLARIPTIVSLLALAFMVKSLVQTEASRTAGTFGALALLINPMTLQKTVTAEPDLALTAMLFAAFLTWWKGERDGGCSLLRWTGIGLILAAAALMKGPQPIGYFAFGIGGYVLLFRRWTQIPGLILAGIIAAAPVFAWYWAMYRSGDENEWARYLRMNEQRGAWYLIKDKATFTLTSLLEMMPATLLLPWAIHRQRQTASHLGSSLLLYAGLCTLVLFLWPAHITTRYAMPAMPAFVAFLALGFDHAREKAALLVRAAIALGAIAALYPIVNGWVVAPMALPGYASKSYATAMAVTEVTAAAPGPIYKVGLKVNNVFGHMTGDLRSIAAPAEIVAAPAGAYALGAEEVIEAMKAARGPDAFTTIADYNDGGDRLILVRIVR
ncbi:MAG: glycosyltransferase family 39 protein [Micropepsaceae bacterium]